MSLLNPFQRPTSGPASSGRAASVASRFRVKLNDFFARPSTPSSLRASTNPALDSSTGLSNPQAIVNGGPMLNDSLWRTSRDRIQIWKDLADMEADDELVSTALDIIADCATGFQPTDQDAFQWVLGNQKSGAAMQVLNDLKSRLNLGSEVWQIVRNFVMWGEEFREVVISEDGLIQRLKYLPSCSVWPNVDLLGNKVPGWEQRAEGDRPGSGVQFLEWQIVPFIYGSSRNYFGTGLMKPARRTWARLQKLEDGMVIARTLRAYDKLKHKVPVKPEWGLAEQMRAIEEYKKSMTVRKVISSDGSMRYIENPLEVGTDFYIPDDGTHSGDVDILHSRNVQLQNIEDVLYCRDRLLARLKVPRGYLNLGTSNGNVPSGGASNDSEDVQFARTLRQVQAVERRGLMEVASLALFLQGYDADRLKLKIILPAVNNDAYLQDSQMRLNLAHTAEIFTALFGGMPVDIIAREYMRLGTEDQGVLQTFLQHASDLEVINAVTSEAGVVLGTTHPNPQGLAAPTGGPLQNPSTGRVPTGANSRVPGTQPTSPNPSGKNSGGTVTRLGRRGASPSGGPGYAQSTKNSPSLQDVAGSLSTLLSLVQSSLESYTGESSGEGREEVRRRVQDTIVDSLILNSNGNGTH